MAATKTTSSSKKQAPMRFCIAQDPAADDVLSNDPFAVVVGMMLDQQYGMEHAFRGAHKVLSRFGTLDPATIATADPDYFKSVCSTPPAIHRYPGSMSTRLQELAAHVVATYDGDVTRLWTEAATGAELSKRVQQLPGFGKQKAQIFVALLAKQLGVRPEGWEAVAGDYALDGYRSVADVVDAESLVKVREYKQARKAAAKTTAKTAAK
ncbi:MAG TPA: HhH-GPD-type base excision DNA repair protein [Sporichthya sp.]|nr:HhH-GPD-type base excision DNA repair protein [Sporichthya sp.]